MADSLCGPSNALQNFQKHSTVDRTLQQDRLVARQPPSQGFRSSPGPNAGVLDPEFEAFQHGGNIGFDGQHGMRPQFSNPSTPFRPQLSHPMTPQSVPQAGSSAWASDFQRLHVSSPQPSSLQHSQSHTPAQQRQDAGGWHQDFTQQFQGDQRMMQSSPMGGQAFGNQYSPMNGGMGMGMGGQMGMGMQQYGGGMMGQSEQVQQSQPVETFDDEAFARAFEEASREILERQEAESRQHQESEPNQTAGIGQAEQTQQNQPVEAFDEAAFTKAFERSSLEELERQEAESRQQQSAGQDQTTEMGQDVLIEESAERFMATEETQVLNQVPIGADRIQDPKEAPPEDPDALSRTAAHLLDSVSNNKSDKFANSEFLELMRAFRDKELMVHGDKIIDSNGEPVERDAEVKVQA